MTVYARKEICGYKPGEPIEVYGTRQEDGRIMFLVWAKSLGIWVWVWASSFVPYPVEDE